MAVHLVLDNSDLAKPYDEISDSQFERGSILVDKLGIAAGNSVLDIGAGTGRLGRHVIDLIGPPAVSWGSTPWRNESRSPKIKIKINIPMHSFRLAPPRS